MRDDAELRQIPIVCPGHSRPLAEVTYSPITPEGFFLISACHDKNPMLRRGETGDWVGTFEGHKGAVWSAQLNSSTTLACTGSADYTAKVWNAITGEELHSFTHDHVVKSVAFSQDSQCVLTGGHDKCLRIFDLKQSEAPIIKMRCEEYIRKLVVPTPTLAITGEAKGQLCVWDLRSGTTVKKFQVEHDVMDMELSRNNTIFTVTAGKHVYFYDVQNDFALIRAIEMPGRLHFKEEGGASLHPTFNRFIAGGSDTWVRVFDFDQGHELECHKGHHGPIRCLRYAPDGKSFATGSEDGTIRLWQTDLQSKAAASVSSKVTS